MTDTTAANFDAIAKQNAASEVPEGFEEIVYSNPLAAKGDVVTGVWLDTVEKTMKQKVVKCYRIQTGPDEIAVVIGAAQLHSFFNTLKPGATVWIKRGDDINGGQGRVTEYRVAVKK